MNVQGFLHSSHIHIQMATAWLDDSHFFYFNPTAGKASTSTLSTRQLCRILCPITAESASGLLRADTALLIGHHIATGYSSNGWQSPRSIPILREACADWYYSCEDHDAVAAGPVSCRALAEIFPSAIHSSSAVRILVWSPQLSAAAQDAHEDSTLAVYSNWTDIKQLPHLQFALEALQKIEMPSQVDWAPGQSEDPIQHDADTAIPETKVYHHRLGEEEEEEEYQSDGGTNYIRCPAVGIDAWVPKNNVELAYKDTTANTAQSHSLPAAVDQSNNNIIKPSVLLQPHKAKKTQGPKFKSKNAKNWIYVTGLPPDTHEDEVAVYFSKAGVLALDPETQKPKIKLYRSLDHLSCKGDASICYARPESVDLAVQILDESHFRPPTTTLNDSSSSTWSLVSVQRAKFEKHTQEQDDTRFNQRKLISSKKRKIARLAAMQATDWNDADTNTRIVGGIKGLRIIVLKHMFTPGTTTDDDFELLEKEIFSDCSQCGTVEKITVFSQHLDGIVIVKFSSPSAATCAIQSFHGKERHGKNIEAIYWDGVTDFNTMHDDAKANNERGEREDAVVGGGEEDEHRLDEFGEWLDNQQDLPEEFKLQVGS